MNDSGREIRAIAFDYGGVLAEAISEETVRHMAAAAGSSYEVFRDALWSHRAGYDAGDDTEAEYWQSVLRQCADRGEQVTTDSQTISLLSQLDSIGWSRLRPAMIRWAALQRSRGYVTCIISNMAQPTYEMVVRGRPWLSYFHHVVISAQFGSNKPAAPIFEAALELLRFDPAEVLFLDDLPHNVAGAREAGLRSVRCIDPAGLAETLATEFPAIEVTGLTVDSPAPT